jgi:hypothetical protein
LNCEHCGPLFFPDRESLEFHADKHHDESIYAESPTDFGYFMFEGCQE